MVCYTLLTITYRSNMLLLIGDDFISLLCQGYFNDNSFFKKRCTLE